MVTEKINLKKLISILFVIVSFILSSCHDIYFYRREYPELHSIAIESIIGAMSNEMNRIVFIDEDNYKRKLFAFMGYSDLDLNMKNPYVLAIIVSQKTDDQYAYYYDTKNYKAITIDSEFNDLSLEKVDDYFSFSDIETLKLENDWNKPIVENQLFRVNISRKKVCSIKTQDLRKYKDLFYEQLNYNYIDCYSTDRNGMALISVITMITDLKTGEYSIFLLLLNKEHELVSNDAIMKVPTQVDLEKLFQFKLSHGWAFNY